MRYTEAQAEAKAKQIYKRFGLQIRSACAKSHIVPDDFMAGFIGVEAGLDWHTGLIDPTGKRFEPGVYHKLLAVRDGLRSHWSGISTHDLTGMTDNAIANLATSWGLTQIMGWHLIHNLEGTIQDLRDPDKHLDFTVALLVLTAHSHLSAGRWDKVLRIWNTGSENGKTYDDDYVPNALSVKKHYAAIAARSQFATAPGSDTRFEDSPAASVNEPAVFDTPPANGTADDAATLESADASPGAPQPATQTAENITNVQAGNKTVPDNFVAENKSVDAPAKEGSTAKAATMTVAGFTVPAFLVGIITAVKSAIENGFISAQQIGDALLTFFTNNTRYVFAGVGLVIAGLFLKKLYKQITLWLSMYIAARADMHNVTVNPK